MTGLNMIIDALIVWRLTHLIQSEDGPFDIFVRFQSYLKDRIPPERLAKDDRGFWAGLFSCFMCLSVWIGTAVAYLRVGRHWGAIGYGLALSGAAILLQLISGDH